MDNFEKELFGTTDDRQDSVNNSGSSVKEGNSEPEVREDLEETETEQKYWIICLPRTRIEEVEVFLRSRNIDNYDTFFSVKEFEDELKLSTDRVNVYLFDFIGEMTFRDIFIINRTKFSELTVFTNKNNVAEVSKSLTDKVYLISELMDILTLFWDSDVFEYDNVVSANESGIELVNKRALEIQGKKLDRLELCLSVENEKSSKYSRAVKYINIEKKIQGRDIGKVKSNFVKRAMNNFISKFKKDEFTEEYEDTEQIYSDGEMEFMNEDVMYKLENRKLNKVIGQLSKNVVSSITEYMLEKEIIDKSVYDKIESLKNAKQISGLFCEVDYAIELGLIDEVESINIVNDYYCMYCLQHEDVLSSVVLNEFKYEGCVEFKCFCTRGIRRDVNYFVIDPDNMYGKRKIEEMFNNFEYVYTKEKYIVDKLRRMEAQ